MVLEGGALLTNVPEKRPIEVPCPFHHVRTQQEGTGYEQGGGYLLTRM